MSAIAELDPRGVRQLLRQEQRAVLVDFWSPWCAPCRVLRPHLVRLAEERSEHWRFVAVNTETHPGAAEEFAIRSLPTFVLFRDGQEVSRLAGGVTLSSVAAALEEFADYDAG